MSTGVGIIPVLPVISGTWPFVSGGAPVFPSVVSLTLSDGTTRTFVRATWAWPYAGVVAQYREDVAVDAMHVLVYASVTPGGPLPFEIEHLDEANPDRGLVLEHAVLDAPRATKIAMGVGGLLLGLVGGLFVLRS